MNTGLRFALAKSVTKADSYSATSFISKRLSRFKELVITLDVESAERDTGNETYDFYITTGDGISSWDIAHFAQVASTGAKRFVARVNLDAPRPENVTNASPGVAAIDPSILTTTDSTGTHLPKTLGAGLVRNGPIGDRIGYELVVAGTVATGIKYSIQVEAR